MFISNVCFRGTVLRWRRNRMGRPLSPPQIHQKNISTLSKFHKTTSECWQRTAGTQKSSSLSSKTVLYFSFNFHFYNLLLLFKKIPYFYFYYFFIYYFFFFFRKVFYWIFYDNRELEPSDYTQGGGSPRCMHLYE